MNKKFLFIGMAAILGASLSFFGCDDSSDSGGGGAKSDNAELTEVVVKGRTVDLTATSQSVFQANGTEDDPGSTDDQPAPADPTEGDTIANAIRFGVTIAKYRADDLTGEGDFKTEFTAGDNGSFKAVYLKGGVKDPSETEFESDTDFPAYADGALNDAAGGRFLVRVIPENEDTEKTKWYRIAVNVVNPGDVSGTVGVTAGDTKLLVEKTGGEYRNGLKVFVKDDGTGVTITTAETLAGSTKVTDVEPEGDVIPVITLDPATATGGSGVLKEGPVTVTLAGDAQEERVTGITASSFDDANDYTLAYNGNGETAGTVPTETSHKGGTEAEVAGNTGNLEKTGSKFAGWTMDAAGNEKVYAAGSNIRITENTVLYAKWETVVGSVTVGVDNGKTPEETVKAKYTVKFEKTGDTTGSAALEFAWNEPVSVTATVTPTDNSDTVGTHTWRLDGIDTPSAAATGTVFEQVSGIVSQKEHTLVLVFELGGEKYSEDTTFTVTAPPKPVN